LNRPHQNRPRQGRRSRQRQHVPQGERRHNPPILLNDEGIPAAVPDAPRPSPIVLVAAASRARFPWLPARVIAGSVWRGPANELVRIDEFGAAEP